MLTAKIDVSNGKTIQNISLVKRTYRFNINKQHQCMSCLNFKDVDKSLTRSSAIAEGSRDALCQLKSCQLLHRCTKKISFEKACNK